MNPWHDSIEILNHSFIVKKVPEWVDQIWKLGQNRCEKALLLDPVVKLCLPESSSPLWIFFVQVMHIYILCLVNSVSTSPSYNLIDFTTALQSPTNICARHSMVNMGLGDENGVIAIFQLQWICTDPKLSTTVTGNPHNICLQGKILHHHHRIFRQVNTISTSGGQHTNVSGIFIGTGTVVLCQGEKSYILRLTQRSYVITISFAWTSFPIIDLSTNCASVVMRLSDIFECLTWQSRGSISCVSFWKHSW